MIKYYIGTNKIDVASLIEPILAWVFVCSALNLLHTISVSDQPRVLKNFLLVLDFVITSLLYLH